MGKQWLLGSPCGVCSRYRGERGTVVRGTAVSAVEVVMVVDEQPDESDVDMNKQADNANKVEALAPAWGDACPCVGE